MSFDLYFASTHHKNAEQVMTDIGCCRLFSQLRERHLCRLWLDHVKQNPGTKLFIDSGAFSAWSIGRGIDVDEYINYINNNTNELTLFASVDNIPGELTRTPTLKEKQQSPILSWENYLYMRERVKDKGKLLPVFHIGEDFKYLNNMCNIILDGKHIPYIGLGGTVGIKDRKVKENWYKQCFRVIKDSKNPNVKVHAFGMTNLEILENYPFESADSTTWLRSSANGNIITRFGTVCVSNLASDRPNHISKLPKHTQEQITSEISYYGLTLEQCSNDYGIRDIFNIYHLQDWAENYKYKGNDRYQKRLF